QDGFLGAGKFVMDERRWAQGEVGMSVRVVADLVARCVDGAGEVRGAADVGADLKEGGGDVVGCEDFEDGGGVGTGAVVEGQCEGAAAMRGAPDRGAEELGCASAYSPGHTGSAKGNAGCEG